MTARRTSPAEEEEASRELRTTQAPPQRPAGTALQAARTPAQAHEQAATTQPFLPWCEAQKTACAIPHERIKGAEEKRDQMSEITRQKSEDSRELRAAQEQPERLPFI